MGDQLFEGPPGNDLALPGDRMKVLNRSGDMGLQQVTLAGSLGEVRCVRSGERVERARKFALVRANGDPMPGEAMAALQHDGKPVPGDEGLGGCDVGNDRVSTHAW